MPRHELADSRKESLFVAGVPERQVFGEQLLVEFGPDLRMFQQRLDFRGKSEQAAVPVVVKGLNAQAVARAEQPLMFPVPNGEGEHPTEASEALVTVLLVRVNNSFGVAMTLVAVSGGFELRTDVGVIEDLAVVGDPE